MNIVLILYPALFTCQTKFDRKVGNIIRNMSELLVCHLGDANNFVEDLLAGDKRVVNITELDELTSVGITHAIVFDDGEVFEDERAWLEQQGIPLRWINVPITRVINIKKETEYEHLKSTPEYEYIGRGSYWGNPYSMFEEGESREEVIRKYQYDFDYEKFPNKTKSEVYKLTGKRLGCFCKPQACHGDVLAGYLNSFDDEK
jgi:hypothetical protein